MALQATRIYRPLGTNFSHNQLHLRRPPVKLHARPLLLLPRCTGRLPSAWGVNPENLTVCPPWSSADRSRGKLQLRPSATASTASTEPEPARDGPAVLAKTQELVETAMLAATVGLAFFLASLLRLESYLGCFFPLPVVIGAVRWGALAGGKTMVATMVLLLLLAGPLKALSYMLAHGVVGLAIGVLWRWHAAWGVSIVVGIMARCAGAVGFLGLTSWLMGENLLALFLSNAHASLSHSLSSVGINVNISLQFVYASALSLLIINCTTFIILLHVLYAVFLKKMGYDNFSKPPSWVLRLL